MNRSKRRNFMSNKTFFELFRERIVLKMRKVFDAVTIGAFLLRSGIATACVGFLLFGCLFFLPAFFH